MARFYGKVGYGDSKEDPPDSGVWVDDISEISYFGDVVRNSTRLVPGENLNPDIDVSTSISIMADQHAIDHFSKIKYVEWAGELWVVTTVESKPPRLILNLGEVYNGPTPG